LFLIPVDFPNPEVRQFLSGNAKPHLDEGLRKKADPNQVELSFKHKPLYCHSHVQEMSVESRAAWRAAWADYGTPA
jgi:hypothetical protein